jgi:hypothetical protein
MKLESSIRELMKAARNRCYKTITENQRLMKAMVRSCQQAMHLGTRQRD